MNPRVKLALYAIMSLGVLFVDPFLSIMALLIRFDHKIGDQLYRQDGLLGGLGQGRFYMSDSNAMTEFPTATNCDQITGLM